MHVLSLDVLAQYATRDNPPPPNDLGELGAWHVEHRAGGWYALRISYPSGLTDPRAPIIAKHRRMSALLETLAHSGRH